jgi:Mrp family chromosome partitioning ATPase
VVFLGGLVAGLALAFVIEFYFDRSFKRPIEIETKLGLPLFLSIPEATRNGQKKLANRKTRLLTQGSGNGENGSLKPDLDATELQAWRSDPVMQPFFEALRDRLITHFEIKDINHKPKLVAITSCTPGSGVSTVASGLAASLSETGEGNVLLVDMNTEKGAAHFFHKGQLDCGLDQVLENNSGRENAQVEKNLFVVSESTADEKLPRILHKRFSALIPKLHASDFDYIIFDMPPVSQTSATTRVARFMDIVFMVVEAEKTDRDVVKRASQMLTQAKATNVGVVLNKSHNYVPGRLNQEL